MKKITLIILAIIFLYSCEDPIDIDIENGERQLVVDAVLNSEVETQNIVLSLSGNYFNQDVLEVTNAKVRVFDSNGNVYEFENNNTSTYTFIPSNQSFITGNEYTLEIVYNSETYTSISKPKPVPPIDSITWSKEQVLFGDVDSIIVAQFWGVDLVGVGDTYWIRSKVNGKYLDNNTIAFDASTGRGALTDNVPFIAPIRFSITPNSAEEGERLEYGDQIEVELYSVSSEFADFWIILNDQLNNGGLFATPPTNVPSNIKNVNSNGSKAIGWFEISNVSRDNAIISIDKSNNKN